MYYRILLVAGRHIATKSRHLRNAPVKQVASPTPTVQTGRNLHHLTSRGLNNPQRLFKNEIAPITIRRAGIVSAIINTSLRLARLRYLALMGGAAGGATVYQKVDSWRNSMIDTLNGIPGVDGIFKLTDSIKERASLLNLPDLTAFKESLSNSLPNFGLIDSSKQFFARNKETVLVNGAPVNVNVDETAGNPEHAKKELLKQEKAIHELHEKLLEEETKHQQKMEQLKNENNLLRRKVLVKKNIATSKVEHNTTDMYSQVLDELAEYSKEHNIQDHLPRVVVVGDQSAGKTSVLEMIAQARIFPRGSGEMMTRSPVKVTMSEGSNHIAKFNDCSREYNLKNETELEALRTEIERRMKLSVSNGQTVSNDTISLTVKGPRLRRMILVDLPGIISTVTTGMASDTKSRIRDICKNHMRNPNSIILCIQDGSLDAERSNVTDLVSSMDPSGKRTIFVMTKVDVAENNKYSPDRIRKILEGKLFPMKALGYFAVVTGKGNSNDTIADIKKYEEEFFRSSSLLKNGVLKSQQMSTENLSLAVSKCFWKMVRDTIDEQAQMFEATGLNLQKVWEYKYPKYRKQDKEELFLRAKNEILDEVVNLSLLPDKQWHSIIKKKLWEKISDDVFNIFLKATLTSKDFNYVADVELNSMANKDLPRTCMEVGETALQSEFQKVLNNEARTSDPILKNIKKAVGEEKHEWNKRAEDGLRLYAKRTLADKMIDRQQHKEASEFMETVVKEKLEEAQQNLAKLVGPGTLESWTNWKSRTAEENNRKQTVQELQKMFSGKENLSGQLDNDHLTALRKNLEVQSVNVDDEFIQDTWSHLHKLSVLKKTLASVNNNNNSFFGLWNRQPDPKISDSLIYFFRIDRMLDETSKLLKQQLIGDEVHRLEKNINRSLNIIEDDEHKLTSLLKDERVTIVERLNQINRIQKLLGDFMKTLNREKKA